VDPKSDVTNCGGCGNDCTEMWCWSSYDCYCVDGECMDGCYAPMVKCMGSMGDECVDPQSNPNHCGTCNTKCGAGMGCYKGQCQVCPSGTVNCSGTCIDTMTDEKHCGACNSPCETPDFWGGGTSKGLICQAGTCVCPAGQALACGSGASARCVSFLSDTDCGLCSAYCGSGTSCSDGSCQCLVPKKFCKTSCVDTQSHVTNCGSCGTVCPKPEVCSEGTCAAACAAGLTSCGRSCVDLKSSSDNCGKCYNKCPAPKTCVAGACV
jgi:hypothetical protein